MEYNQFKQLLDLKGIREKETVSLLKDFIEKFPYCQTSRLLYAKVLHDQNNIHYDQHLKLAAAYASSREVLRDLISAKTEEVEFEFPLSKKVEPVQEFAPAGNETAATSIQKPEIKFEEWYTDAEISGQAFEEQKEKEKPIDPHAIIKQRLSEILVPDQAVQQEETAENIQAINKEEVTPNSTAAGQTTVETSATEEVNTVEVKVNKGATVISDPEETVFKEDILAEEKMEAELMKPADEKSKEEKEIAALAEKAVDVLDKMELEHALEESILDSIEKLPVIAPEPANKKSDSAAFYMDQAKSGDLVPEGVSHVQLDIPRSFTEWLKTVNPGLTGGFEGVHSLKTGDGNKTRSFPAPGEEDPENLLSDDELIEKFLLEDPKIIPSRTEFYSPLSQAKKSVMDHDDVVSETLAQIYLKQGNFLKARWCYEKLILLHPEKSAFFATLLKEIPKGE